MCGKRVLLIETGMWLAAFMGGDGGDSPGDVGDGAGEPDQTTCLRRSLHAKGLLF
jgi:hypothetical protein